MAEINLAKALKIKNRLTGRLAKVQVDIHLKTEIESYVLVVPSFHSTPISSETYGNLLVVGISYQASRHRAGRLESSPNPPAPGGFSP
jgi:hypothetical protein